MRKFSPLEELVDPKTAEKNRLAAMVPELSNFSLPTSYVRGQYQGLNLSSMNQRTSCHIGNIRENV